MTKSIVLESPKRLPLEVRDDMARASFPTIRARSTRSSGTESDRSNSERDQMMYIEQDKGQQASMVLISE
jgi:hypothetical protein